MNIIRKLFGPSRRDRIITALLRAPVKLEVEAVASRTGIALRDVKALLLRMQRAGDVNTQFLVTSPPILVFGLTARRFSQVLPGRETERYLFDDAE